ncbi:MAG: hypothetical protein R3309_01670 [Reinekea sp.]|nr:hypothetical protein [Reinekea sp.]
MRITQEEYFRAIHLYETSGQREKGIRMGQYLMNNLAPKETNAKIFYEGNEAKAKRLFVETYVDPAYPNT